MVSRLLILTLWLTASVAVCASPVDRCITLDDSKKISILQKELTKAGLPYYMNGDIVCVTNEYADQFTAMVVKTFPPDSNRKLRAPPPRSGVPLNSTKLTNPTEHVDLEAELKQRGIWFIRDETGAIWYEVTREKEVRDITFQIIKK
jgi:hypothetical protein